ncbi:NAD-dependent epimerase/dehydratase family protein [Candidatus Palauibacter sp.]|uniref:NAD-dependent epimerase/dehydratase family protein n=1 Tax=Candidatus Palauibacter sp. TaxID=3101350 RepID=UPI003CC60759
MSTDSNRRDFLKVTAAAGAALGLGIPAAACSGPAGTTQASGSGGRLLILGGTGFIGPYQVRSALDQGLEVTIFNRGSRPGMFEGVEELVGDRNGDFESLRGRTWDVVIDNSTSRPDWVTSIAEFLRDSVEYFYYVSSRSAYASHSTVPMTSEVPSYTYETAGLDRATADITQLPYGLAKAESEREVMRIFPDRYGIFRPGLIIGPDDPTDRFTYWPVRIQRGGEVLSPGDGTDPVQIIDVRDLGDFMALSSDQGHTGIFNLIGPATPRPMAELLYGIRAVTTAETTFTWVPREFLAERGVRSYAEMPVWRPPTPGAEGFARFDLSNEVAHGLTFRSLADTTQATLDFHFSRTPERQAEMRPGLPADREAEILREWHASQ